MIKRTTINHQIYKIIIKISTIKIVKFITIDPIEKTTKKYTKTSNP
jgi:hypothetical protein